jgi:uncharacterized membrane protein HdeD (DUF308 family)
MSYETATPDATFMTAEKANVNITSLLRALGSIMMALGLYTIFNPLAVSADVLPILGASWVRGSA